MDVGRRVTARPADDDRSIVLVPFEHRSRADAEFPPNIRGH
jgi:hypothetical protein